MFENKFSDKETQTETVTVLEEDKTNSDNEEDKTDN